jgi:hypothetical protein
MARINERLVAALASATSSPGTRVLASADNYSTSGAERQTEERSDGRRGRLTPVQLDGTVGTGGYTNAAAITQTGINIWRLTRIHLQDGLATTDLASQALATDLAEIVDHMRYARYLCPCMAQNIHLFLHPLSSGGSKSQIPLWGIS